MLLKIDFHVHTDASKDCGSAVEHVVKTAVRKGLDGIAITDHNTTENNKMARELGRKHGLVVISGEEVRTKKGDVLVFGLKKTLPKDADIDEILRLAKKQRALVFAAHPHALLFHYPSSMKGAMKAHEFDGVEVFNSRTYFFNHKGMEYAKKKNLVMVAGSDAHSLSEIGNAYTVLKVKEKSEAAVLEALRKKKVVSFSLKRTKPPAILKWYFKRAAFLLF